MPYVCIYTASSFSTSWWGRQPNPGVSRLGRAKGAGGGIPDWISPSFSGGVKSPQLHRVSRALGSWRGENSSGETTELGEDEGSQLCSMTLYGQAWETQAVEETGVADGEVGKAEVLAAGTRVKLPQGPYTPSRG